MNFLARDECTRDVRILLFQGSPEIWDNSRSCVALSTRERGRDARVELTRWIMFKSWSFAATLFVPHSTLHECIPHVHSSFLSPSLTYNKGKFGRPCRRQRSWCKQHPPPPQGFSHATRRRGKKESSLNVLGDDKEEACLVSLETASDAHFSLCRVQTVNTTPFPEVDRGEILWKVERFLTLMTSFYWHLSIQLLKLPGNNKRAQVVYFIACCRGYQGDI